MAVDKCLIFGVDAADFDVIKSSAVDLPTFDRLIADGVSAELESTLPPVTGAAWPAMACGRNPNSIGMFDFVNFSREDESEYRPTLEKVDPFWSYLSEVGYRVGISGFPLAPLDTPVDGFVLSWPWYLPEDEQQLTPPDFFDGTDIDVEEYIRPNTEFEFDQVMTDLKDKIRFDEHVLETFDFDVYYTYLDADTIIHMTDDDDMEDLYDVYRTVDAGMDRLLDHAAEDCAVLVVSDHGFSEVWGHFHTDQFLKDEGVLSIDQSGGQAAFERAAGQRLVDPLKRFAKRTGLADIVRPYLDDTETRKTLGFRFDLEFEDVDWSETTVVTSGNWGQLYDLTADRSDIEDMVDCLKDLCAKQGFDLILRDPATEYGTEDLHPDCPDVVVTIRKNGQTVLHDRSVRNRTVANEEYFTKGERRLNHHEIGVFIAAGPGFVAGETAEGFHLTDVAPIVLSYLTDTVPPGLDGANQPQLYEADWTKATPEIGFEDLYETMSGYRATKEEGIDEVKEKLGHLGYFE